MSRNGKSDPQLAGEDLALATRCSSSRTVRRRRNFYYARRVPGALVRRIKRPIRPPARTRNFSCARLRSPPRGTLRVADLILADLHNAVRADA